ncbi:MAG: hypothetical protein KGZ75_09330 [Syntrophomonadaceae bacterium]|nr:hypothetical protein [Syntrophomonadaceae bacterium]
MAFTQMYSSIDNELNALFYQIHKEVKIILKTEGEDFFSRYLPSPVEKFLFPAAVIYSAKAFRVSDTKEILDRAKIAFYVYMASYIHQLYEREPTANKILCGDYFFAQYYAAINEANSIDLLKTISQIICRIHENRIHLLINPADSSKCNEYTLDFAKKNTGLLLGECCALGAAISADWPEGLPIVKNIGVNLGIALILATVKGCDDSHIGYIKKACQDLIHLPKGIETRFFSEFIDILFPYISVPAARRVVV